MGVRRVLMGVVAVLVLAALVAPAALAKQPDKQVPLQGEFAGVGTEFSGNFSHLGRFDGLVTSDPGDFPLATATWTAANGDTVDNESVITGDFACILGGGTFPVCPYTQEITIVGGTGRFLNASGSATVTGTIDLSSGEYDGHLVGTISQPGPRE